MLGFVVGNGAIDATTCSSSAHISITCLSLFPRFDSVCNLCGGRRSHYFWLRSWKKTLQPLSNPILFPPACNTSNCMVALEVKRFDNCLLAEGLLKVCFRKLLSDSEVLEICLTGTGILTWTRESCDTAYKSLKEKNTYEIPSAHGFRSFRAKSPTLNQTRSTPKPNGGFGPACVLVTLLGLAEPITPNACAFGKWEW